MGCFSRLRTLSDFIGLLLVDYSATALAALRSVITTYGVD